MLAVCNLLGVDVMTGHWEFTYGSAQILDNIKQFKGDFIAQNVSLTEEAQFVLGAEPDSVFKPYVIKEFNKAYPVSGWASVSQLAEGRPMADVLVDFMKQQ